MALRETGVASRMYVAIGFGMATYRSTEADTEVSTVYHYGGTVA